MPHHDTAAEALVRANVPLYHPTPDNLGPAIPSPQVPIPATFNNAIVIDFTSQISGLGHRHSQASIQHAGLVAYPPEIDEEPGLSGAPNAAVLASRPNSTADLENALPVRRGRGRPRRAWNWWNDPRGQIQGLPVSHSIDEDGVRLIFDGTYYAGLRGTPINYWYTVAPWQGCRLGDINSLMPGDRSSYWIKERGWLRRWLSHREVENVNAWSRESERPEGRHEHMHLALHLPGHLSPEFRTALEHRYGGAPFVKSGPASGLPRWSRSGRHETIQSYLVKCMSSRAAYGRNLHYRRGGPIAGVRCGVTDNIGPDAYRAWKSMNGIATR